MKRTLIIYESRYGFTEYLSNVLCKILGPANLCKTEEFKEDYKEFDMFVICTPVYMESFNEKICSFIEKNKKWLKHKEVVILYSCLSKKGLEKNVERIKGMLDEKVICIEPVLGILQLEELNNNDRNSIERFFSKVGIPLKSYNMFNKEEFVNLALNIKRIKDKGTLIMDDKNLKKYIEQFLTSHNTCCLCTGFDSKARASNIEYSYIDNYIYFISEGGEKFANIFINNKVSVGICDPYKSMNDLAGMQISGRAYEIAIESEEYKKVLKNKGLNCDQIINLPIKMNIIKVEIDRIEFLWSNFKKLGYDVKQILDEKSFVKK